MMEESAVNRDNVVTLTDDEGNEHDFAVIDAFLVDEKRYAILLPAFEDEEEEFEVDTEGEAYIFRVEIDEETGEEIMLEVEDEKEWERVAAVWEEQLDAAEEDSSLNVEDDDEDEDFF